MKIDQIAVTFFVIVLITTSLRYMANIYNRKNKRKTLRELIIIACLGILWIYGAINLYVNKNQFVLGLSSIIIGTILVLFLVIAQIRKIYKGIYTGQSTRKRELIIKYAFMFLYITIAYTFINVTVYLFDQDAFNFLVPRSEAFQSITDILVTFVYFTVSTVTALGYGDIVPVNTVAKLFVAIQNFTSFAAVSVLLSLIMVENKKVSKKAVKEAVDEKGIEREVEKEIKKELKKEITSIKEGMKKNIKVPLNAK